MLVAEVGLKRGAVEGIVVLPLFKAAMPYNKLIIYVVCCAGRTSTVS